MMICKESMPYPSQNKRCLISTSKFKNNSQKEIIETLDLNKIYSISRLSPLDQPLCILMELSYIQGWWSLWEVSIESGDIMRWSAPIYITLNSGRSAVIISNIRITSFGFEVKENSSDSSQWTALATVLCLDWFNAHIKIFLIVLLILVFFIGIKCMVLCQVWQECVDSSKTMHIFSVLPIKLKNKFWEFLTCWITFIQFSTSSTSLSSQPGLSTILAQ